MLLDHAHTLDDDLVLGTDNLKDLAFGATMVPGNDTDGVSGVDVSFDELKFGHGLKVY